MGDTMTNALKTALAVALALAVAPAVAEAKKAKSAPKSETAEIDAFFKDIDKSFTQTMKQIDKDLAGLGKAK
jgi:hypothetical protein